MKVKIFDLQETGIIAGKREGVEKEINNFLKSRPPIHHVTQSSVVWNRVMHTFLTIFYEDRPAARETFPS